MEAVIDKFGRIVIPKKIRDHLGLSPGTHLDVQENDNTVIVKAANAISPLQNDDGVMVFTGARCGDIEDTVRKLRQEQLAKGTS